MEYICLERNICNGFLTHIFFFQVEQMVDGVINILRQSSYSDLARVLRTWLRKPYVNLK